MDNIHAIVSLLLAGVAGACFISGAAILFYGRS